MTMFHWGPDPGHGGLTKHKGQRSECRGPDCGDPEPSVALTDVLARLDTQNWDRIAHRVSAETGADVDAAQVRRLAIEQVTREYQAAGPQSEDA